LCKALIIPDTQQTFLSYWQIAQTRGQTSKENAGTSFESLDAANQAQNIFI
jgi:hypothetical protein